MIFTPNSGRLVKNKGRSAQCIAQATDVAMPNPSRLIFSFMLQQI